MARGLRLLSRRASKQAGTQHGTGDTGADDKRGPIGLTTIYKPEDKIVADIVFVHGLDGGSLKTWTKDSNPDLFWPQMWLPKDAEFCAVRIHTFGYDADWEKSSILDIDDFAKSLIEWVIDSPNIPRDSPKPMVLVCHSMGGLVAKKAYILSRQLHKYEKFGSLVQSIFFLATPHHGANLAETLALLLKLRSGQRPFVGNLQPASKCIQLINEEFPRYSDDLDLFSFYETLKMKVGVISELVVPKDSATLGYPEERTMHLKADHRGVCKFDSSESSNYRAVRDKLAAAVEKLSKLAHSRCSSTLSDQQHCINVSLDITDAPEDDYLRTETLKIEGSCEWITSRALFKRWRLEGRREVYWINAKPGAGKSVLCGHVLRTLRDQSCDVSFFFFTHGDKLKSSLSACFRSLAWQMASKNAEMFQHLAKLCNREPHLAQADYRTLWRKLFLECVLSYTPKKPQYWVIDALDECRSDSDLVPYLLQAASTGFIRVFLTSRTLYSSYRLPLRSDVTVHTDIVTEETTKNDIELYLAANSNNLPGRDRAFTASLLLEKSGGCFLWVKLALQELRQGLTRDGIRKILEEIPSDMDYLYGRIIENIFQRAREAEMIKAILDWTACAARILNTDELYHALRLDMDDEIDGDIRRFIEVNCGQLVVVDKKNWIRMIHLTARDFLFSEKNSKQRLDRKAGNKRLAMVCLKYLTGPEMTGSRPRKLSASQLYPATRSVFSTYASDALFDHIVFVDSEDDEFATALSRFLKSPNVLAWIEHVSRHLDLGRLVHAGNVLRRYTARRMKKILPFGNSSKELALFDNWATDLVRLVTKFGLRLRESPYAIVNLIAPFCPVESAIHRQFASSNRAIKVNGISAATWDDCASTMITQNSTSAIACTLGFFAVGTQGGCIAIINELTCQEIKLLNHGETVKTLLFGTIQPLLISAGLNTIKIWDTRDWVICHSIRLGSPFMSLALTDEDRCLFAACRSNEIYSWETESGHEQDSFSWLDEKEEEYSSHFERPVATAVSGDQTLLAVAYRGQDVTVWDIDRGATHDVYGKDEGSLGAMTRRRKGWATALGMVFSSAPEVKLLVVAYNDAVLNLFNTEEGILQARASVSAHTLASSADGLTLACGNSGGTIQIFEFDTLKPLYRIQADQMNVKQLAFSSDNNRLLDIQGKYCRVWDPPVLVRANIDEENSDTISVSTGTPDFKLDESSNVVLITSIATVESGKYSFCGKENGSIYIYDAMLGRQETELLQHAKNVPIVHIDFESRSSILVSVDVSSRLLVHKLQTHPGTGFKVLRCLLDHRVGIAIYQILINAAGDRLLVATEGEDTLWAIQNDEVQEIAKLKIPNRRRWRWSIHPLRDEEFVLVMDNTIHLFDSRSLERLTKSGGIEIKDVERAEFTATWAKTCFDNKYLSIMFAESVNPRSQSELFFLAATDLNPEAVSVQPASHFQSFAAQVQHVIGVYGHRIVFLHRNGWICSADSQSFDEEYYDQHFFLPTDWMSTVSQLRMYMLRNGSLLFVKRHELVVIRRGMEHFEHGQSKGFGKRPSLSRSAFSDPTDSSTAETVLTSRLRKTRIGSQPNIFE